MKVSEIILDYLKKNGRVVVTGFGVFELQNSRAEISSDNDKILPPSKKIIFDANPYMKSDSLINFIAKTKNISNDRAVFELQTQIDFWKKKLQVGDDFSMGRLGNFVKENNQLVFIGSKIAKDSPDFYGLEEIAFSDIKNKVINQPSKKTKKWSFSQFALWFFLFIIPVGGLIFLAITQQDYFTGKKSIDEITIKNSTHRIKEQPKEEPKTIISDSIKTNSLQPQSTITTD